MRIDVLDEARRQRYRHPDRDLLDDLRKIVCSPGHGFARRRLFELEPDAYATDACYHKFSKNDTESNRLWSRLVIISTA